MYGQIVDNNNSSRIELEPHYVRIFFNNYQKSDFINRVPDWPKSTIKLIFCPEDRTVNLYGNLIYVSNLNKSWVAEQKNFSFSYFVPVNRLRFIQIDSSLRKINRKSSTITNSFSFKLGIDDAKRLYKDLQMGHQAIEKRFNNSNCDDVNAKSKPNKLELTTVLIYLDKLSQKDLQSLANIYPANKLRMDKLSEHTLLHGENNGPPPPIPLQKCLKLKIKKMTLLDELKSGGFKISGKLVVSFSARRIDFFVTNHGTRIEHFITKTQILGLELINNSNKFPTIHLALDLQTVCLLCSKLIRPAPSLKVIKMMIKEFRQGEKSGTMSHCIVRIQFRRKLKQEEKEHFKHFYPVIGKFPSSTTSLEEENINLANNDETKNLNDDSVIEKTTTDQLSESKGKSPTTTPDQENFNLDNDDEVMDNNDESAFETRPDQELSEVEKEEEELKPLNLDIKKLKIDQHTICYSSTKFNHYITLIMDGENLRIIGNGQINRDIEEKVYFYFKIPINSPEIDREIEVAAVPGLKSRIKFSLSSEESNYVRGLLKKSLLFYGLEQEVGLTRFEFILAKELNGLQLAHLRSIKNIHLITKSEEKCVQVKTEITEQIDDMGMEDLFFEKDEFETDDSNISLKFQFMHFGTELSFFRNCSDDQILDLILNQNNSTIKIIGDLKNYNNNNEKAKFVFQIPMDKINNLEVKKIVTGRKARNIVQLFVYPNDFEMEIIRKKLSGLKGCPINLIQNHLKFVTSKKVSKAYADCKRILQIWKNSRNGSKSPQNVQLGCTNDDLILTAQSIHFGQYVYTGQNSIVISSRSESTKINIFMQDFKGKKSAQLVISDPTLKKEPGDFKMKYFLSDYGVNNWTLFFIPHPKCQKSFASKLKFRQLVKFFDPSSEDMEKSYIRLVFEFPPYLQERDKKIEFCNKLNDIFDTYLLSYIDLVAERNIKIIEKNLGQNNNQICMETG